MEKIHASHCSLKCDELLLPRDLLHC